MTPDQLLQKSKELTERFEDWKLISLSDNFSFAESDKRIRKIEEDAKALLSSIENGEVEGCGFIQQYADDDWYECGVDDYTCDDCQQKINEAEKILREVLE